jgi:hypothetical protein
VLLLKLLLAASLAANAVLLFFLMRK